MSHSKLLFPTDAIYAHMHAYMYMQVDLNDMNHSKLLFPTVARYEDARLNYCDKLMAKHGSVREESVGRDLPTREQRLFVTPIVETPPEPEETKVEELPPAPPPAAARDPSPGLARRGSITRQRTPTPPPMMKATPRDHRDRRMSRELADLQAAALTKLAPPIELISVSALFDELVS